MTKDGKMSDIQKQASKIIVEAYKKGGRVYYKDVKDSISADIESINKVLLNHGKLNVLLTDGSWYSFDLDISNMKLKGKNIPDIFKEKKRGSWRSFAIGVSVTVVGYFVIQLIIWIAGKIGQ